MLVNCLMVDGEAGILIVKQLAYENANAVCQIAFHPFRKNRDLNGSICLCADIGPGHWTLPVTTYFLTISGIISLCQPPPCLPFVWVLEPCHTSLSGQGLHHLSHQPSFLSRFGCTTYHSTYYIKYNIHVINIIPILANTLKPEKWSRIVECLKGKSIFVGKFHLQFLVAGKPDTVWHYENKKV